MDTLNYIDILGAKEIYKAGGNVSEYLCKRMGCPVNSPEIIEVAYDAQAGTYIEYVKNNEQLSNAYAAEVAEILNVYVRKEDQTILDIGTGELTTLSLIVNRLAIKPCQIYAFDISWSRLFKGLKFAQDRVGDLFEKLNVFVADIQYIPMQEKSVSITISSHALEPNGSKLPELIKELFRVTSEKLVLFEPCYEINSPAGKKRMDELGYIKNLDLIVESMGGKVIEKIEIKNISNPLNPTVCFVIEPPPVNRSQTRVFNQKDVFSLPGTSYSLEKMEDFYINRNTGLCFPILKNIPIFKRSNSILATALLD